MLFFWVWHLLIGKKPSWLHVSKSQKKSMMCFFSHSSKFFFHILPNPPTPHIIFSTMLKSTHTHRVYSVEIHPQIQFSENLEKREEREISFFGFWGWCFLAFEKWQLQDESRVYGSSSVHLLLPGSGLAILRR